MTKARKYRVLGIDPGLNITGYGIVDFAGSAGAPGIIEGGAITTDPKADIARRIEQIHADLAALIAEFRPDLVAIENLYAHPRTSILMAHARGVVLLAAQQAGIAVCGLSATKVKKNLTGNGHASKLQIQRAIQAVCRLETLPQPPDVADALAIALCAGRQR
jgi:crossover junction endodeoxyribonuclease RuvC